MSRRVGVSPSLSASSQSLLLEWLQHAPPPFSRWLPCALPPFVYRRRWVELLLFAGGGAAMRAALVSEFSTHILVDALFTGISAAPTFGLVLRLEGAEAGVTVVVQILLVVCTIAQILSLSVHVIGMSAVLNIHEKLEI